MTAKKKKTSKRRAAAKKTSKKSSKKPAKKRTKKRARPRAVVSPVFAETPVVVVPEESSGGGRGILALVVLAVIIGLVYLARRGDAPDDPSNIPSARRPAPAAAPASPPSPAMSDPAVRGQAGADSAAGAAHSETAVRRPAGAEASTNFDKPVTVTVRPGNEGATLRVYSNKPRKMIYSSQVPAGAGSSQLSWDGKDKLGKAVPAGLYYLSISDADGVRNEELWVR